MLFPGSQIVLSFKSRNLTKRTKELEIASKVYSEESDTDKNFGDMEYLMRLTLRG